MSLLADAAAIFGASQANKASKKQLAFQKEQFEFQKKISNDMLAMAKQAQRQGLATQVDSRGNVVYYDEASNTWKSVLSLSSQALQDTSDREQLQQLGPDAAMARGDRLANARRRSIEGATADADLASYQRMQSQGGQYQPDALAASMRLNREGVVNDAFNDVSSNLATQALRSGATGGAGAASRLARARAQALAEMRGNPEIEAMQLAQGMNNTQTNNVLNRYNLMASRAGNSGDAPFNPSGVGENVGTALAQSRANAGAGVNSAGGITGNAAAGLRQAASQVDYTMGGQAGQFWAGIGDLVNKYEDQAMQFFMPGGKTPAPIKSY